MVIRNAFIFLSLLYLPGMASGADIFVKKQQPQQQSPSAVPETSSVAVPVPPTAETIYGFAERYHKNCMAKKNEVLKGETQSALCDCSKEKLIDAMTVEEVRGMSADSREGQALRNKMLLRVYAPCLQHPAKALIYTNCVSGPDVASKVPNYEKVCGCMSESMSQYVAANGPSILEKNLAANPSDQNPLQSLMNSPDFQTEAQGALMACLMAP